MKILCESLVCLLKLSVTGTAGFYLPFGSHLWACFSINWPSLLCITHRLIDVIWMETMSISNNKVCKHNIGPFEHAQSMS